MPVWLSSCSKRGGIATPMAFRRPQSMAKFLQYPSSHPYACSWAVKENFLYPTPPFLSGDWSLRSLTRLTGPTYSPVIPCLIYSFQNFMGLSVITLALHLVKLPSQGYQYAIRPISIPTKPREPPITGIAAIRCLKMRKWGSRLCDFESVYGSYLGSE